MTFNPTENRIPFGLLTKEEQEALKAWPHGWEAYIGPNWDPVLKPSWTHYIAYRGKPAPLVPDYINWDHVAPQFICMARDQGAPTAFLCEKPLLKGEYLWRIVGAYKYLDAGVFASYRKGTVSWDQSLVWRPGHEPKGEK